MTDAKSPRSLSCRRSSALRRGVRPLRNPCPRLSEPRNVDVHIGRRLNLLRNDLGLSREMLANGVNLTIDRVEAHERGIKRIRAYHLVRYAEFFGVQLRAFFK